MPPYRDNPIQEIEELKTKVESLEESRKLLWEAVQELQSKRKGCINGTTHNYKKFKETRQVREAGVGQLSRRVTYMYQYNCKHCGDPLPAAL